MIPGRILWWIRFTRAPSLSKLSPENSHDYHAVCPLRLTQSSIFIPRRFRPAAWQEERHRCPQYQYLPLRERHALLCPSLLWKPKPLSVTSPTRLLPIYMMSWTRVCLFTIYTVTGGPVTLPQLKTAAEVYGGLVITINCSRWYVLNEVRVT